MLPNLQNQDTDLSQFFTDVEFLQKAFKELAAVPKLPKRLFVIHAVGGAGKSSLLRIFRLHCKSMHVPVALASGDESKSAIDILARWADGLQTSNVKLTKFNKTFTVYRTIQARVDEQAHKVLDDRLVDLASKATSKTAEAATGTAVGAALGSIVPGIGTLAGGALGGVVGSMGAEVLTDWLRGFLTKPDVDLLLDPTKRLTDDFLDDLTQIAEKQRLVLILDTFEQMSGLDDWVRDFTQRLHVNVLLVIAGRTTPDWDRQWPGWMANANIEELKPMTEAIMRDLVHNYYAHIRGGDPEIAQVETIIRFARGLPLAITIAVQLWVKYDVKDFADIKSQVVASLVKRLREGVSKELLPMLDAAAVVRYFNEPILRAVSRQDDVSDAFAELCNFPFTRPRAGGFMLHDIVREILDENLRVQDPERHSELHKRAAQYFETRLAKASGPEAERLELERLYQHMRLDEKAGIKLFQEIAENLTRYGLINRLRELLNDTNTYKLELKHENSRLWLEYYKARLAHDERRYADAEKAYQAISENSQVEPKLKAYALCDWGEILVKDEWLGQEGGGERAIKILEAARQVADIDTKLVFVFTHLSRVYGLRGEWQLAIDALQSQVEFFEQNRDKIGIVKTLAELRWTYGRWGNWGKSLEAAAQAYEITAKIPENSFLKTKLVEYSWITLWIGRYQKTENYVREGLAYAIRVGDFPRQSDLLGMLGYTLGLQNKFDEALLMFAESIKKIHEQELYADLGGIKGFLGNILVKQGELDKAEETLHEALLNKREHRDIPGISEIFNWLGELFEIRRDWPQASSYYYQSLDFRSIGRRHFECGALTGLARVRQAQNDGDAITKLLTEAESLAQQYEYNDHLASLSLTQAHRTWGNPDALRHFQHALLYALRFNRFLLDEVLSGRPQGTPLAPIISYLGERGGEGQQVLAALREWWCAGVNDTGTPRPDTVSLIPEAIPLLEAERIARGYEPGNGLPQKTVIEQIEQALGTVS